MKMPMPHLNSDLFIFMITSLLNNLQSSVADPVILSNVAFSDSDYLQVLTFKIS